MTDSEVTWRDRIPDSDREAWYAETAPHYSSLEIAPETLDAASGLRRRRAALLRTLSAMAH
jgi:hypothetical protein